MTEKKRVNWCLIGALAAGLGVIVAASTGVGVWAGARIVANEGITLPLPLHAGSAAKGKSISMATGLIDGDVEGLYLLDHASGNLQCWILNSRNGAVAGIYRANVATDLMGDKAGAADYVMVTGNFFYNGGNTGNLQPGQSVVYVADESTGNVVGYHLTYDKQAIRRNQVITGPLNLVCKGVTRGESTTRDQ